MSAVTLVEVGLRDGLQTESALIPTETKLSVVRALAKAGLRKIQLCSFVNPKLVPQMADAEVLCAGARALELPGVSFSGLILNTRGLDRARAAGVNCADMSLSASDTHSRKNANKGSAEALVELTAMIAAARAAGMTVRAGVQCAFGCVYEGEVPQSRVLSLCESILASGIDELLLADSTGMANPRQMQTMLSAVKPLAGDVPIVLHLHDTRGMGLANVLVAVDCGVTQFDSAFGGLGGCPFIAGAAGNIATEDTAHMLEKMGLPTGVDWCAVAAIARDLETALGKRVPGKLTHLTCN
jgi:hydroxymethylglutaryl-CoA lyase